MKKLMVVITMAAALAGCAREGRRPQMFLPGRCATGAKLTEKTKCRPIEGDWWECDGMKVRFSCVQYSPEQKKD